MRNTELAKIFYEIADFLAMEEVPFKPYAYQRVALALEGMEEDVAKLYLKGGRKALEEIPGVGKNIADKIEEYLKTGKIKYYQKLKKKTPVDIEELTTVEGLGPKKVKVLYQKLGIRNIKDLEKAARGHKIAPLFGFGSKTEENILEGIEFLKRSRGRFLLGEIWPVVKEIENRLLQLKEVQQIEVAGSVRRRKETIGDVDFLVVSQKPKKVMEYFCSLPGVVKVWGKGPTKSSVRLEEGLDIDLRVVPKKSFGAALQYFTGSKEHNIATRKMAIDKGLKLSEYGLFQGPKMIAGKSEREIYKALGMAWMPPEMREDQGEVEAALSGRLPKVIGYNDIKGDLHCHSHWDGGEHTIEEMAKQAQAMGYEYLGIADHTKFLRIEHGLDERQLAQQRKEINKLNSTFRDNKSVASLPGRARQLSKVSKFRVLQGCEANILKDGSVDIKDEALAELDYVIAGVHSHMKMPRRAMTERLIKAMKNPHLDIISHPTGRLLQQRDEYEIDFDRILRAARATATILEINASPQRLDLNDQNIRRAKEEGVKMVINTDSHHLNQLRYIELGIAQARRGWAEKKDIINTQPLRRLLKFFQ